MKVETHSSVGQKDGGGINMLEEK